MIIQGLENSPWGIAWTVITIFIVSIATRSVYRLYFHPLSKFPGPKLTAITHLYEFYYDCIQSGQFLWEIARMHEQYGVFPPVKKGAKGVVLIGKRPHCTNQPS